MRRILIVAGALAMLPGCSADGTRDDGAVETVQPLPAPATPTPTAKPAAPRATAPVGPSTFVYDGELEQGGWIVGQVPAGTVSARLDLRDLTLSDDGRFFAGFDRDAPRDARLVAKLRDGRTVSSPLKIAPRDWRIEHINVARTPTGPSESFMKIRRPELARINAARSRDADSDGWSQDFIWPVEGRISGRFGSQRVYQGVPASYHTGLDIAPGGGVPYVAPADGVVTLAANDPFSLEGKLLIIDHGMGLNSAFLHSSTLAVKQGDVVRQGQLLGTTGASGRATGPHLHWSIKWRDARLDPLLFLPPQ